MGSIPKETIEQIAAANDVVEVIGSYFPLKRAGASYKALCPFHQEKTPSFHVSPSRQTFHCFGCGVGGSVFRFVMEYEHVDFPTAVRRLAARVGLPVIEERSSSGEHDRQQETRALLLRLHAEAAAWFHHNLMKGEVGAPARDYLKKRGIDRRIAGDWQLGFAPESWDGLLKWATREGYRREHLVQSGLVKLRDEERPQSDVYDRFRGRVIFPICNDIGEVVAFSGRILDKSETAKYLNSPETPLFRKGNILFGLHKTKRELIGAGNAIVCEGQLDLITLFEAGIRNVVAPQGTAFTESQARVLKRYVNEVILCFDADSAGEKAAERSLDALLQNDLVVRVLEMPAGEDPDSFVRKQGREQFEQLLTQARDFFEDWIERELASTDLNSVAAKTQLARKLAQTISRVHDSFMRGEIAGKASARLGLAPAEFTALLQNEPARPAYTAHEQQRRSAPAPSVPHDMAMLCLLALRDAESRGFLCQQEWEPFLAQTPDAELLRKILGAELNPDDAASMNAFLATLPPAEEAVVSGWLMQKLPKNPLEVTREWWNGLRQRGLRRQLQIAEHRMKLPQISAGEIVVLQKQILDLQEQLREIPQLSPARVLDA